MMNLFRVIFSSFHCAGKVHVAAIQQPPLPVTLSCAEALQPCAKQGPPLPLLSCLGFILGSHQEGIKVPAPFSGEAVPSICPAFPRQKLGPDDTGAHRGSLSVPPADGHSHASSTWLLFPSAGFQKGWADAVGEAFGKRGGTEGHRGGLVQTGVNWCVPGKGKAKDKAKQKEGDWGCAKLWAVNGMATRHRDRGVRGQAALLGAWVLGTCGTKTAHPKAQGRVQIPAFLNTSKQKGVFVFPCQIQGRS